jgi:hypothetical protein
LLLKYVAQPVPAQVRHGWIVLPRPLPWHCWQCSVGCVTETCPFPPQTIQEAVFPGATFHFPDPLHHAHFAGALLLVACSIFISSNRSVQSR